MSRNSPIPRPRTASKRVRTRSNLNDDDRSFDDSRLRSVYDGFAKFYWMDSLLSDRLGRASVLRSWLMAQARGRVLDVACGQGENFAHLTAADAIVAVDLSPAMIEHAAKRASKSAVPVETRVMSATELGFPDQNFDTVVSALATCTYPDPNAALREMARVLKPDGELLLLEHGRSSAKWLATFQDRRSDRHYRNAGCRWNQDVEDLARAADLEIIETRRKTLGVFVAMRAKVPR